MVGVKQSIVRSSYVFVASCGAYVHEARVIMSSSTLSVKSKIVWISTFVGSRGPDPGSDVQGFPTNPYTTIPFGSDFLTQAKFSPEVVWVGAGNRFLHPGRG